MRNAELFQQGAKVYAYEISLVLHVYSCIILSDSMVTKLLIIDSLCHKIAECMEQMLYFRLLKLLEYVLSSDISLKNYSAALWSIEFYLENSFVIK